MLDHLPCSTTPFMVGFPITFLVLKFDKREQGQNFCRSAANNAFYRLALVVINIYSLRMVENAWNVITK